MIPLKAHIVNHSVPWIFSLIKLNVGTSINPKIYENRNYVFYKMDDFIKDNTK